MAKTGFELPKIPTTGIDTEQVKAHLEFHSEANRVSAAFKEKVLEQLLSANFLVFIITAIVVASGFIFMTKDNAEISHIMDYWKLILPVVTTYIGYAIGKGQSSSS